MENPFEGLALNTNLSVLFAAKEKIEKVEKHKQEKKEKKEKAKAE